MQFKQLSLFAVAALSTLALLSIGCKKTNNSSASTTLTATVGTTAFTPGGTSQSSVAIYNRTGPYFDIAAVSLKAGDTSALEITFPLTSRLGVQVSSDTALITVNYTGNSGKKIYFAGLGFGGHALVTTTTQDTVNHKIAGTFVGTIYNQTDDTDSLIVTNGKFNTAYTPQ